MIWQINNLYYDIIRIGNDCVNKRKRNFYRMLKGFRREIVQILVHRGLMSECEMVTIRRTCQINEFSDILLI
jgi:hypothetical protein